MPPTVPAAKVVGIGLVTPLGDDAVSTWQSLLAGRFISDHRALEYLPSPRLLSMSRSAAQQALHHAGWSADESVVLIGGSSKGPVEEWLSGNLQTQGLVSWVDDLAIRLDFPPIDLRLNLSAACASGLHALIRGVMLIHSGAARRVLVVAAEASVLPIFLGTFERMGVLAPPGYGCRPFDENRKGFVMTEAAAAICLQAGPPGALVIDRFALGGDATHLTSGDPHARTLRHLLERWGDDPIDLVHAHGTGTAANDAAELSALESFFAERRQQMPSLFSHKAALGHSMGASGLVSVALNVLCHEHRCVPPNIRTHAPLPTRKVRISKTDESRHITRSIAIATGFGGATAVVGLHQS